MAFEEDRRAEATCSHEGVRGGQLFGRSQPRPESGDDCGMPACVDGEHGLGCSEGGGASATSSPIVAPIRLVAVVVFVAASTAAAACVAFAAAAAGLCGGDLRNGGAA